MVEQDLGAWSFRRFQHVLDIEMPVVDNPAQGFTATYIRREGAPSEPLAYATAFVTVYRDAPGLTASVRPQVRALTTYDVTIADRGGGRHWLLDGGAGDRWALWVSGPHLVRVGGSEELEEVPEEVLAAYMARYPSDLDEHGRARDGSPSAGPSPGSGRPPAADLSPAESTGWEETSDDGR